MAYPHRYGSREEGYSNNSNRLSGGFPNGNDSKGGGLMRRFTTNALPTLSPIGQQRRQAAGDTQMVSTNPAHAPAQTKVGMAAGGAANPLDGPARNGGTGKKNSLGRMDTVVVGEEQSQAGGADMPRRREMARAGVVEAPPMRTAGMTQAFDLDQVNARMYPLLSSLTSDDKSNVMQNRASPSERRIRHIERLLEQQRTIAAELDQIADEETLRGVEQGLRHERAVSDMIAQSEPTTPPEDLDIVPNVMPRPNRFSSTSLTSPPGIMSKSHRSSAPMTSPLNGVTRPYTAAAASNIPSQSVPGSRRQSDDEEEHDVLFFDSGLHRSAAKPNRNSMPVTSYDRTRNIVDRRSLNTNSSFFYDDEEPSALPNKSSQTSPPDTKTYLQVQHTADGFPKLIRREDNSELLIGPSAALDLALSSSPNTEQQVTERGTASRHRISLPPSALSNSNSIAPLNSILANSHDIKAAANSRRSLEVKFTAETKRPALMASPPRGNANGVPKKNQFSYSTNDIPTLKSIDDETSGGANITSPSSQPSNSGDSAAQDPNSVNLDRHSSFSGTSNGQRHSQDFASPAHLNHHNIDIFNSTQGHLQGSTSPFGAAHVPDPSPLPSFQTPNMPFGPPGAPAFYGGYGMHMLHNGFNNMSIGTGYGNQGQWSNQASPYQPVGYGNYPQYPPGGQVLGGASRYADNSRFQAQQRKAQADDLYNTVTLQSIVGQIYTLCKDQHGCRFLQKKLDDGDAEDLQIIFDDVKDHFQELMIDPFGNYLCQRLLERANDDQRDVLVANAAPSMTRIALNQHGTRALQKMIEFISTEDQTNMIIEALRFDVVQLIQDLNGNHVIQKCLNHLNAEHAQFIFDAVGSNCVTVGTHRHGCCVLQRCVDHASGPQKGDMIGHIIANAFTLVQDPFGNYVVQYILDLSEPIFTEPLCRSFCGNVSFLSKQKFSSNVIEKCMRCAGRESKTLLIQEIVAPQEIERLLRDSYANYVVQTAMEFAEGDIKVILYENIRPILPLIRHTPHGRRIQSKIQEYDAANEINSSGRPMTDPAVQSPYASHNHMGMPGHRDWVDEMFNDIAQPTPQRNSAQNFLNGNHSHHPNGNNGGQGPRGGGAGGAGAGGSNFPNFSRPGPGPGPGPGYGHF